MAARCERHPGNYLTARMRAQRDTRIPVYRLPGKDMPKNSQRRSANGL